MLIIVTEFAVLLGHLKAGAKPRIHLKDTAVCFPLETVNNFETNWKLNTAPGMPVCDVLQKIAKLEAFKF